MSSEEKAAAYDKATELATAATKTGGATYGKVLQACIDMSQWQYEQDCVLLDAKDEIEKLQAELEEGGFNDERNFI